MTRYKCPLCVRHTFIECECRRHLLICASCRISAHFCFGHWRITTGARKVITCMFCKQVFASVQHRNVRPVAKIGRSPLSQVWSHRDF